MTKPQLKHTGYKVENVAKCVSFFVEREVNLDAKTIVGRNTALHYAKQYPDQSVVKFLLRNGAKIDVNQQKLVNISPRYTLQCLISMLCKVSICANSTVPFA